MGAVEQRAHDAVAPTGNGRESRRARPADGVHEEGLGAVVRGVGSEDASGGARGADLFRQLVGELVRGRVACQPADVLDVAVADLGGELGDVDAAHRARDAVPGRQVANELLVLLGVDAAEQVVDVEHVQALAGDVRGPTGVVDVERGRGGEHEQGCGVGAARDHENDGRAELVVLPLARTLKAATSSGISSRNAWHGGTPSSPGHMRHVLRVPYVCNLTASEGGA